MDRKAIVQGLYKRLKIREIATLSKCGLATVQRTKDYLQEHNIPLEEAIELTESQLQALFDQPHRKPDIFAEEDFADGQSRKTEDVIKGLLVSIQAISRTKQS